MRFTGSFLILASLLFPVPIAAQQAPERDGLALQLLHEALVAMGGSQKHLLTDVWVEGTVAMASAPEVPIGTFVAKVRGADFSVETFRGDQQISYRVLRGLGTVRRNGKLTRLAPYNTAGLSLDLLPLFSRWVEFLEAGTIVHAPQAVQLDGVPCYAVRVEAKEESEEIIRNDHGKTEVFIHTRTAVVVAILYRATQGPYPSDQVNIENRFADYRDFSGVLLPTKIVRFIAGMPMLVLNLNSVRFNNGFSDADFRN